MRKRLLLVLSFLLILPLSVRAEEGVNVKTVEATVNNNTITFNGTTQDDSVAVMCKLFSGATEVYKLSVEVNNKTFTGSFVAEETGTYTVSCANYDGGTIVSDEAVVSALETFTVTFNTNGGSSINAIEVEYGNTINEPEAPTKDDKVFGGWYEDSTLTTPFEFSTHITANKILYAKWNDPGDEPGETPAATNQLQVIFFGTGGTYQVDFAANDSINPEPLGEPVNSSHRYFVDEGVEVTLTAIPINGYHFVGWYSTHEYDSDGHGTMAWALDELVSNQIVYSFTPTTTVNLQAVFEENNSNVFTVTFNTNGGSAIAPIEVEPGHQLMLPQNPTKDGFVFIDWYEDDTFTTWFDPSREITADLTLYAKWHEGEHRNGDQIQVWAATGGKVAVQYTPSEPNVYELDAKDGTNFVPRGEVVQFYSGDEITAKASADEGYRFVGWKHVDIEYGPDHPSEEHPSACMGEVFSTASSYTYRPGVTVIEGDNEAIRYVCADFEEVTGGNSDPGENPNPGENPSTGDKEYTVSDEGVAISFTEEVGHTYSVEVSDYTKMTDADLAAQEEPMTREEYEAALELLTETVKQQGTLLSILEINVFDENHNPVTNQPESFTIRINMTDDLKGYNTFKLVYLDRDNNGNIVPGDVIDLSVEGNQLVGILPHLSTYVLTGSNTETTTGPSTSTVSANSPKTYDGILIWIGLFVISGIGLLIGTKVSKLKK